MSSLNGCDDLLKVSSPASLQGHQLHSWCGSSEFELLGIPRGPAIKAAVAYDERAGVIEALWSVVLADGARDDHEDALMRMVAPMLGISDRDSAIARQRVEAGRA